MNKAKYIGKYYGTGYNKDYVFLEYEYRGVKYEVYENRAKGNEPLSWQHKNAQLSIDEALDHPKHCEATEPAQVGLDYFFDLIEGKFEE